MELRKQARIMAHMVPYFPNKRDSLRAAQALVDGGASYLEVQFPYTDPVADGPVIQAACADALQQGFTVQKGWDFVAALTAAYSVPVFVMSYVSLVYAAGVNAFIQHAQQAGARGVIVPDMPVDCDEGLYAYGKEHRVAVVPVIVSNTSKERVELAHAAAQKAGNYIYVILRSGVTGQRAHVTPAMISFFHALAHYNLHRFAGFGIASQEQVSVICKYADTAVIGSALVQVIAECMKQSKDIYGAVKHRVETLVGRA